MMYRLAGFTGLSAQILKMGLMALIDSFLIWMLFAALAKDSTSLSIVIAFIFIAANFVYFAKFTLPLKFLLPGMILLLTFVLVPLIYTVTMSGFNYRTGNEISKDAAIEQIIANGLAPDANNTGYDMTLGKFEGDWSALLLEQGSTKVYLATPKVVQEITSGYEVNNFGIPFTYPGFTEVTPDEASTQETEIVALKFPFGQGQFIAPQALDFAALLTQAISYDKATDTLTNNATGATYKPNDEGNFVNINDPTDRILPGWRAWNFFRNYTHLLTDPVVRGPFIGVFIWTISFAFLTVLSMFSVGLLLALILNRKIKLRRFYRSVLILPYAIPSFMSILIWAGMFNRQFGAINGLFGTQIDFMNSPTLAKMVILIVNLWLGFPYFYLISSGALQAIPTELEEAASLDGASTSQILRRIKLPLLLQILSPLLIASFAFNFNNFNIVYLLTGGGPTDVLAGKTAGATDILITYTYKTAFGSNEQNLGLASAISVLIFFIVGGLSLWSLRRSKVLETF
jgi:arabinogalactan oligomer/maltooligosaccharide transport system permease protein